MTLGNMRHNGVQSLWVYCRACHRDVVLDVDAYPNDTPVPVIRGQDGLQPMRDGRCRRQAELGRAPGTGPSTPGFAMSPRWLTYRRGGRLVRPSRSSATGSIDNSPGGTLLHK